MKRRRASSGPALSDRAASAVSSLEQDPATPEAVSTSAGNGAAAGGSAGDDAAGLTCYPGGKNAPGVFQRIINQMPPHENFIELFLGSGAVMRRKRPASGRNVGIDVDPIVLREARALARRGEVELINADAREWVTKFFAGIQDPRPTLIYADPPYLGSARHHEARDCYRHEMKGADDHEELLRILTSVPALVMISGYPSPLYDRYLSEWRRIEYWAQTRGGQKREVLWMNFPEPEKLHDYGWLGRDFRERTRIKRKIARWTSRLRRMPHFERQAIMAACGAVA